MNPEQEKLLRQILSEIITACYREMGEAWCRNLYAMVDELKNAGKP